MMKVSNTSEIDISGLKTGMYLCEIDFGDCSQAYKFLKN
ncbi:MAG: T9SS type A sorting domain-containing protein [Bacteroidales bacterium]|nr:T9SS type A sorting domain-containing protein [Bacteroidales bacterium]